MKVNGVKYYRFYIRLDQMLFFENLLKDNNIDFFNEKELYTKVNSTTFYINKKDCTKIDKICVENNIELFDDYSHVPDERITHPQISKWAIKSIIILIFVLILVLIVVSNF